MTASLDTVASHGGPTDWAGFQLPVAVVFAVMSGSAGLNLATDIERGYFDKLLLTPVSRVAILVGAMAGDLPPIVTQGRARDGPGPGLRRRRRHRALGAAVIVGVAVLWERHSPPSDSRSRSGPAAAGPMRRSGLFVPLLFLTTTFAPLHAMADWPGIAATLNPVTYILDGMRALTVTRRELDRLTPHCSPPEPSARATLGPGTGERWCRPDPRVLPP